MTTGQELILRGDSPLALPADVVAQATAQANALMDIVHSRDLFTKIGNKEFLVAEAWQVVSSFNETAWVTEWVRPIEIKGEIVAYEAKVNLVNRHGLVVGAAIMSCGLDDDVCKSRDGWDKHKTAMSAAETWAGAKASRMKFAWVAVLAGFAPTPAEEMIREKEGERAERKLVQDGPLCPVHKVPFVTTIGKDGSPWTRCPKKVGDGWCKEKPPQDKQGDKPSPPPVAAPKPPPVATPPVGMRQVEGTTLDVVTDADAPQGTIEDLFPPQEDPATVARNQAIARMKADQERDIIALAATKGVTEAQIREKCKEKYAGRGLTQINGQEATWIKKSLALMPDKKE